MESRFKSYCSHLEGRAELAKKIEQNIENTKHHPDDLFRLQIMINSDAALKRVYDDPAYSVIQQLKKMHKDVEPKKEFDQALAYTIYFNFGVSISNLEHQLFCRRVNEKEYARLRDTPVPKLFREMEEAHKKPLLKELANIYQTRKQI